MYGRSPKSSSVMDSTSFSSQNEQALGNHLGSGGSQGQGSDFGQGLDFDDSTFLLTSSAEGLEGPCVT